MNFILSCEIYPFDVICSFNESKKDLYKVLKKLGVPKEEWSKANLSGCEGIYTMFSNGKSLIRLREVPKNAYWMGILNHELLHFVFEVMRRVNIKLSSDSEECFTYLFEYLSRKINFYLVI